MQIKTSPIPWSKANFDQVKLKWVKSRSRHKHFVKWKTFLDFCLSDLPASQAVIWWYQKYFTYHRDNMRMKGMFEVLETILRKLLEKTQALTMIPGSLSLKPGNWDCLAVQWLRFHLPMQRFSVQSLVRELKKKKESIKHKKYCKKFSKVFKNGPRQKNLLKIQKEKARPSFFIHFTFLSSLWH